MRYLASVFIFLLSLATLGICANPLQYNLENGLSVILIPDPSAPLVSARTYIKAGSIYETGHLGAGMSHYLEHLVAGGSTTKRTESEYEAAKARLGGASNAYTTYDHTSYYLDTTSQNAKEAVTILWEWMFYHNFHAKEVAREKQVIKREMEKNEADINRQFYLNAQKSFYTNHPFRFPVIGYWEQFKNISALDLKNYYKRTYRPSNMILVIGGRFDEKTIREHINKTFGSEPKEAPSYLPVYSETQISAERYSEYFGKTQTSRLSLRFPTIDLFHEDLYPLDLIDYVLGEGDKSILWEDLVEDKKLAYSVNTSSHTPAAGIGYFDITVELNKKNIPQVQKRILKILKKIKHGRIPKNRIKRAQKQKLSEYIFSFESIQDVVENTAQAYLYSQNLDFFKNYAEKFKEVSLLDIKRAARTYFDSEKMVITVLKPESEKPILNSQTTNESPSTTWLKPKKITLDNGVRLILYKNTNAPRIFCYSFLMGGLRAETDQTSGIGNITAQMLGKKSSKYSTSKITRMVDNNGASISGSLGNNTIYYQMSCLSEDFKNIFPIFANSFLKPKFSKKELENIRPIVLKQIQNRKENWQGYASYKFRQKFFGNHPYANSIIGEKDSVEKLTIADIRSYYKQLLQPNQLVVTVSGDFDEKQVISAAKKYYGKLSKSKNKEPQTFEPVVHTKPEKYTFKLDQPVAALLIGYDTIDFKVTPEEQLKIELVDSVLSGMSYPSSRLHSALRGKEDGLVYMVHAYNFAGIEPGYFQVIALTNPKFTQQTKTLIFKEINDLKTKLISDKEFKLAKSQLKFYHLDRRSNLASQAMISGTDELYGRGYDFYETLEETIDSLKKEDVLATAKKYFRNPQVFTFLPET